MTSHWLYDFKEVQSRCTLKNSRRPTFRWSPPRAQPSTDKAKGQQAGSMWQKKCEIRTNDRHHHESQSSFFPSTRVAPILLGLLLDAASIANGSSESKLGFGCAAGAPKFIKLLDAFMGARGVIPLVLRAPIQTGCMLPRLPVDVARLEPPIEPIDDEEVHWPTPPPIVATPIPPHNPAPIPPPSPALPATPLAVLALVAQPHTAPPPSPEVPIVLVPITPLLMRIDGAGATAGGLPRDRLANGSTGRVLAGPEGAAPPTPSGDGLVWLGGGGGAGIAAANASLRSSSPHPSDPVAGFGNAAAIAPAGTAGGE
eukprot:scaffold241517_cov28-Tisochrysis_lutea.AAC.2